MSQYVVTNRINGLDLCSIQGVVNYQKVKEAGFEFVYAKATQYSSTRDNTFSRNVDAARDAGLRVGAYHFCSHDSDPEAQAEFFYRVSGGLGSKPGELPPMVDWEYCTPSKYANHPAHCVDWGLRFLKKTTELWYPDNEHWKTARLPVLYTYPNYAGGHQPALSQSPMGIYPLCLANYKADSTGKLVPWLPKEDQSPFVALPSPWATWKLWQYSGNRGMPVPGVLGDCDRQVFNGSAGDFAEFLGLVRPVHQTTGEVKEDEGHRNAI